MVDFGKKVPLYRFGLVLRPAGLYLESDSTIGREGCSLERMAFALHILPEQEKDLQETAADFNAAFDEFVATQEQAGLSTLCVWLQKTSSGPVMVFFVEGDLSRYFANARTAAGVEEYIRQKLSEWTGIEVEPPPILSYPQSEELFAWRLQA